jgi:hypothetical protein
MIEFVINQWNAHQQELRTKLEEMPRTYITYAELLTLTLETIMEDCTEYGFPHHERIKTIDYGDYQGTQVFVIGGDGYQPSVNNHYYTYVDYGSCSSCDTLQRILASDDGPEKFTEEQVSQLWTLCLHIIQRMKRMGSDE